MLQVRQGQLKGFCISDGVFRPLGVLNDKHTYRSRGWSHRGFFHGRLRAMRFPQHVCRGRLKEKYPPVDRCCTEGLLIRHQRNPVSAHRPRKLYIKGKVSLAALTSSLVAISHAPWCSVISGAYNSTLLDEDAPNAPFHAIAPLSSQACQLHKILVPIWS